MNRNRKNVPKGKLVRRLGINIFDQPKYDKLLKKKPHGPGMHGPKKKRTKQTEYGKQLVEKQKLKFSYGVSERQIRNIFEKAKTMPGITGDSMLSLLERRLDKHMAGLVLRTAKQRQRQQSMRRHGLAAAGDGEMKLALRVFHMRPDAILDEIAHALDVGRREDVGA